MRILIGLIFIISNLIPSCSNTNNKVIISTSLGDMMVQLYNETPQHRDNFVAQIKNGAFDSIAVQQIVQNFVIQAGTNTSNELLIPAEFVASKIHKKGVLSASRQADSQNPTRQSSATQFCIVQGKKYTTETLNNVLQQSGLQLSPEQQQVYTTIGGLAHLDGNYTAFGEIVEGLEVLDKIAALKVNNNIPVQSFKMAVKLAE